jgi:hypothetical protein
MSLIDERTGSFQSLVLSDRGRFRLAHSGDVKIYENLDLLPRAFIVHQVQLVGDDSAALAAMQDAAFDPSEQAVLNPSACSPRPSNLMQVAGTQQDVRGGTNRLESTSIIEYRPERVVIEAYLDEPGTLLLTDAGYPGWEATVGGEPVSICQADLLFRAVALGSGEHRVVFTFRPLAPRIGGAVSATAVVFLVVVARLVFGPATCRALSSLGARR